MARPFTNPNPQYFSSTPEVLSGAQLFFYAAGGSTKLDTYSDEARTVANANPIVLNSAGYSTLPIFLQDQAYKIVLAPSTDSDPPSAPIWTFDDFKATDFSISPIWTPGSGSPNGSVAGTQGSAGVLPTVYWDYTNSILYICTTTGTTTTAVWTAVTAQNQTSVPPPQGYLTLTSGTPFITGNVVSGTSVYYALDQGNLIPIYNGASLVPTEFTELNLVLHTSHALNTIYDVFVFSDSGVPTIVTGPAWTTSTAGSGARGSGAATTELSRVKGIFTNAVQIAGRNGTDTFTINANLATYVGTILIDGTAGQVTCHRAYGQSRKWGVWNAYNQRNIPLLVGDSTTSWTYSTGTIRQSNAAAGNKATIVVGLIDGPVRTTFNALARTINAAAAGAETGLGWNSTTAFTGSVGRAWDSFASNDAGHTNTAIARIIPAIGAHNANCLEFGNTGGTFYGTEDHMQMIVEVMG